jgi:eukaryotic-like serine/threonine-protein kinase
VTATSATQARLLDGRYELRALIGQGTFGRVYRGHDQRLDRAVAVKVIKPWWTEDREWAERFEQEARLMARVSHPGIVQIYDIGYDQGSLYYVAELVDGESLADRLERGPLPHTQVRRLAGQLCRALSAAHAQRVVHRDVKPENVLIDRGGRVKVGDFGIARLAEASSEAGAGTIVGTPRYMAPEQARGHSPTPATDVYGAGVVLYEMLAGKPPFTESSAVELAMRHLSDQPPPLPPDTPPALTEIAERALAKEPAARYPSGREMADALAGADLERPARARARTRVAPRRTPRINFNPVERRRYVALLAVVIAIVVGMGAAAILTSTSYVRVPNVHGLTRAAAVARARADDLRVAVITSHSSAPVGTVIAQRPAPGARLSDGGAVAVTLSSGPPPVEVPQLVGEQTASAQTILSRAGLDAHVASVPAPGVTPGVVVAQSPPASKSLARGAVVDLSVAETPRWRSVTSFSGSDAGQSVPFRIRGSRWRVVYNMGYPNGCSFIFFCSGPNAQVTNVNSGANLNQFSLNQGSDQTQVFNTGPGVYQVAVTPGSDSASWSIEVDDDY